MKSINKKVQQPKKKKKNIHIFPEIHNQSMGREKFVFATNKRVRFFNTAIDAIFKNWHALQMAVAHVS